jgi:16S rRNA (cytosine967-C5)-methyltransferase
MSGEGSVVAVELDPRRARDIARNAERLGATGVEVRVGDATEPVFGSGFDRVLVDPPCSDLGTLRSRPDARWRKTPG